MILRFLKQYRTLVALTLAVYWVALFIATHIPLPRNALPHQTDKLAHFLAYGGLAFLCLTTLAAFGRSRRGHLWGVVAVTCTYAIVDELLQIPVGRTGSVYDVAADYVGIAIGCVIFRTLWRKLGST